MRFSGDEPNDPLASVEKTRKKWATNRIATTLDLNQSEFPWVLNEFISCKGVFPKMSKPVMPAEHIESHPSEEASRSFSI